MSARRVGTRRGYGPYEPLRPGRPPRRSPFDPWHSAWLRTANLGPLGWLALVGAALLVGLVFAYVAARAGLSAAGGFGVGASGVVLAVIVADRVKWAGMTTGSGFPPPAESGGAEVFADRMRHALAEEGVAAQVSVVPPPEPGPETIAAEHPDPPDAGPSLHVSYRNVDRREVSRVLFGLGVRLPDQVARRPRYRDTGR